LRAAILTNRADSFYKPLAEGLSRMFAQIGVESRVLYDGLASLPKLRTPEDRLMPGWKERLRSTAIRWDSRQLYHHLLGQLRNRRLRCDSRQCADSLLGVLVRRQAASPRCPSSTYCPIRSPLPTYSWIVGKVDPSVRFRARYSEGPALGTGSLRLSPVRDRNVGVVCTILC
jgi:hypothetical protein